MTKKLYAIAPEGVKIADYLTNGKKYEILFYQKAIGQAEHDSFDILNDYGKHLYPCLPFNCSHLNGHSWTIVEG